MKKIWLIAFTLLVLVSRCFAAENLFKSLDLYFSWPVKVNQDFIKAFPSDFTSGFSSDFTYGAKLKLSFLEFRYYQKAEKWNFGAELLFQKFFASVPLFVKAGNLSLGGTYTKINNPVPSSSVNPFSSSVTSAKGISAFLAASSSFSLPYSFFGEYAFSAEKIFLKKAGINVLLKAPFEENESCIFSSMFDFIFPSGLKNKTAFSLAVTGGFYPFLCRDFVKESSWYFKVRPFEDDYFFCSQINARITASNYTGYAALNFYENPEKGRFTLLNENKFNFKNLTILFSEFLNPEESILTPSAKIIEPQLVCKSTLQYTFIFRGPEFLQDRIIRAKPALAAFFSRNFYDGAYIQKYGAGIEVLNSFFLFKLSFTSAFQNGSFQNAAVAVKFNPVFVAFTPSFSENINFTKSSTALTCSEKTSFSFYFGNKKLFYCSPVFSITFTQKNSAMVKISTDCTVSANYVNSKIKISGRLGFSYLHSISSVSK